MGEEDGDESDVAFAAVAAVVNASELG